MNKQVNKAIKVNWIDATKGNWSSSPAEEGGNYPGDTKMIVACLQRMASAAEGTADSWAQLATSLAECKAENATLRIKLAAEQRNNRNLQTRLKRKNNKL